MPSVEFFKLILPLYSILFFLHCSAHNCSANTAVNLVIQVLLSLTFLGNVGVGKVVINIFVLV
jgi:hypothetical protein